MPTNLRETPDGITVITAQTCAHDFAATGEKIRQYKAKSVPENGLKCPSPAELRKIKDAYSRRNAARDHQRYSLWEQGALFRYQERQRATLKLLERNGFSRLEGVKIVDVGCGNGGTLRDFV